MPDDANDQVPDAVQSVGPFAQFPIESIHTLAPASEERAKALADAEAFAQRALGEFPYPLRRTDAATAYATWQRMRGEADGYPLLIGGQDSLEEFAWELAGGMGEPTTAWTTPDLLAAASDLTIDDHVGEGVEAPTGAWPDITPNGDVGDLYDPLAPVTYDVLSGQPISPLYLVVLPTQRGYEAPAYLRYGSWNAYPPAAHHVAILRSWHERFGADPLAMTRDMVVLRVERPVRTREEAMTVALEMFAYCPDMIWQGAGTVENLAASVIDAETWVFWWD